MSMESDAVRRALAGLTREEVVAKGLSAGYRSAGREVPRGRVWGLRLPFGWRVRVFRAMDPMMAQDLVDALLAGYPGAGSRPVSGTAYAGKRGKRLGDEHYQAVADVYRAALTDGQFPTAAVASEFGTAYSNAGRWVMKARRLGFLNEALGAGRPGERAA